MSLRDKYQRLIDYTESSGVENLNVTEQDNVLYISGATTASKKDQIWKLYGEIDPDMRGGDMVLDIQVVEGGEEIYEVQKGDSLSKIAKKYDGMTWKKIFDANTDQLKDPNMIYPGQKLRIPL